jgi:hypothetical protein
MLPHQSTIYSTESLAYAHFYEVLNITGDNDYYPLVAVLVHDAHEKNITISQLHSESQISHATQRVLVDGLACAESNTSCTICMNASVSLRMWCTTARLLHCFKSGYQRWYSLNETTSTNAICHT